MVKIHCDICGKPDLGIGDLQNPAIVDALRVLFSSLPQLPEDLDVCLPCWADLHWFIDKGWNGKGLKKLDDLRTEFKAEYEERYEDVRKEHADERERLIAEHERHVEKLRAEHANEIVGLKQLAGARE